MNIQMEKLVNSDNKLKYSAPKLVCYGALRELTQAGGSGNLEGDHKTQPNQCANNASWKKLCNAAGSDIRLKQDVVKVGHHPLGFGLYLFDYKPEYRDQWGHGRQFGVIAQEVEAIMREAVFQHAGGYKVVDYEMLGIDRFVH